MLKDDFHKTAFDEGTVLKLDILSKYLEKWLPVFLQSAYTKRINIFDFHCGPGRDVNGMDGSPLRIVNAITSAKPPRSGSRIDANLFFNDFEKDKIEKLKSVLQDDGRIPLTRCSFSSFDFEECFKRSVLQMQGAGVANFLFETAAR